VYGQKKISEFLRFAEKDDY